MFSKIVATIWSLVLLCGVAVVGVPTAKADRELPNKKVASTDIKVKMLGAAEEFPDDWMVSADRPLSDPTPLRATLLAVSDQMRHMCEKAGGATETRPTLSQADVVCKRINGTYTCRMMSLSCRRYLLNLADEEKRYELDEVRYATDVNIENKSGPLSLSLPAETISQQAPLRGDIETIRTAIGKVYTRLYSICSGGSAASPLRPYNAAANVQCAWVRGARESQWEYKCEYKGYRCNQHIFEY